MKNEFIFFIIYIIKLVNLYSIEDKIIISLSSNKEKIMNAEKVIFSILEQNVEYTKYKIILILSKFDLERKDIPKKLLEIVKINQLRIIFIKNKLTTQSNLLVGLKYYPSNPILIIKDFTTLPFGWLEMFINDHLKHPTDIISASIQYYFGKNLSINRIIEGYRGEFFGIFNHITDMIFNFALINTYLGGTLYPKNIFRNHSFFNKELFLKITNDSDEFWQSCFIMIENKILRQSSKIYDYTNYIIDYSISNERKDNIYEKLLKSFLNYFPKFKEIINKRQKKIIISFTSYKERFKLFPSLINSLKKQSMLFSKIVLTLTEEDTKFYNISNEINIDIITVKENLKGHKKYFYAMKKFRDYAVITIDDDIYYAPDTFESLYNSYLEYPNLISGRRSHYMTYNKNGELKSYLKWELEQKNITKPDFDVFLTGSGGIIYPPDILNINDNLKLLINKTLTTDDFMLKHLETLKGIPIKWIFNKQLLGIKLINKMVGSPLYILNRKKNYNNICIKSIDISIKNIVLNNICAFYKNIQTGLTIYLFEISNSTILNKRTEFNIYAYSFCPVNESIKFDLYIDKYVAHCNGNYLEDKFKLKCNCFINSIINNLDNYYLLKTSSEKNIKIFNYRTILKIIFKDFIYINSNNCILLALFFKNMTKGNNFEIELNNINYICKLNKDIVYLNNKSDPAIGDFNCSKSSKKKINKIYISGIPKKFLSQRNINIISSFIILRLILSKNNPKKIIIIGKLLKKLKRDLKNILINFINPYLALNCRLKSISVFINAYIYCFSDKPIKEGIFLENQIAYTKDNEGLILINQYTFLKDNLKLKKRIENNFNNYNFINFLYKENYIWFILITILVFKIKNFFKYNLYLP